MVGDVYLLLGEQLRVHHLDLDGNQSQGLKRQATSISVIVLEETKESVIVEITTE